jgi:glycerol-3-phosphate dehydrogenase subunit C
LGGIESEMSDDKRHAFRHLANYRCFGLYRVEGPTYKSIEKERSTGSKRLLHHNTRRYFLSKIEAIALIDQRSTNHDFIKTIRRVMDACADCDTCRFLMEESCLLFPELYRLYDSEKEQGRPAGEEELRKLSELCTLCGLCPCPDIRLDVIRSKTERVRARGMPLPIRLLADVQRFGQASALAPAFLKRALTYPALLRLVQKATGIHPQRRLPRLPKESFFAWAHRTGLDHAPEQGPKVAYFAGCSAGYLFPELAMAAVTVMARNGLSVFVPPQQCCGMPTLLEGDEKTTTQRVRFNLKTLLQAAREGYDIVCSCPTCGYLMKILLKEKSFYSQAYQRQVGAGADEIKVPADDRCGGGFVSLKKSMYQSILKDDGFFSGFNPLQRIALSEKVLDLGELLGRLLRNGSFDAGFGELRGRMVYYAPCHQREQGIKSPYLPLLKRIPGLKVAPIGNSMDCCGMGGSLGFKKDFHDASTLLAQPLIRKIEAAAPDAVITDCLSCRLQFQHLLPYKVFHPVEILSGAYAARI